MARDTLEIWRGRRWILAFIGTRDGVDWYRFAHRTFLEFFAAEHLVYSTTSGEELHAALQELVRTRTGIVFTLLSLEMMSTRTQGVVERWLELTCREMKQESEVIDVRHGSLRTRLNLSLTCIEALGCVRVRASAKELVIKTCSDVAAGLLYPRDWPYGAEIHHLRSHSTLDIEGPEVDEIARLLALLEHLSEPEYVPAMQWILDHVAEKIHQDPDRLRWFRFAWFVRWLPEFDNWHAVNPRWRQTLLDGGVRLVNLITEARPTVSDFVGRDPRLALELVRAGHASDVAIVDQIGPMGLFAGGSQFPVPSEATAPTLGHQLVLYMCGFTDAIHVAWTDEELHAIVDSIFTSLNRSSDAASFRSSGLRPDPDEFVVGPATFGPRASPGMLEEPRSLAVTLFLIFEMIALQDRHFAEVLVAEFRYGTANRADLAALLDSFLYRGDWDGSDPYADLVGQIADQTFLPELELFDEWEIF